MTVQTWLIQPQDAEHDQRRAATGLTALGLRTGNRVALALPNSPELLALVIGAMRVGIVPVMLNPTLATSELDALIADADAQLVVRAPTNAASIFSDGPVPAGFGPIPRCRPMHYTSGTSGRPKGVWSDVLSDEDATALHEDEARVWQLGPDDVHLTCSPLYHSVAIRFSTQALLRGARLVLLSGFDAVAAARAIETFGVRSTFMVPTHLQRLQALERRPSFDGLRLVAHAGAACPAALKHRLFEMFPAGSVWEFYGATEGQFTVCSPEEWLERPGTLGRARAGRELSIDERGQVWCKVPGWARWSYWRDPAKTAAAWDGDTFTVGDLGRIDDDGYLFLDGRRDDLIISGGVNVYPAEVEQALSTVPGVSEVAVFGVADDEWGQRVCAAVIGTATAAAITAHAGQALAGYKRPKQVYVVDDLPRTGTGKVRRTEIAAWLGL